MKNKEYYTKYGIIDFTKAPSKYANARYVFRRVFSVVIVLVLCSSTINFMFKSKVSAQYVNQSISGKGLLSYSDSVSTTTTTKLRSWSAADQNFSATQKATGAVRNPYQTVLKASPTNPDVWFVAINDNAGNLDVHKSTDAGVTWSSSIAAATIGNIGGTATSRRFDIAFEQSSGTLVLAYSKNTATNQIGVRYLDSGGTWSSETAFDFGASAEATVTWVQLAEKRASDELTVGVLTNATATSNLAMAIWDGTNNTFGNARQETANLCDQTAATPDGIDKCFDINYESLSGFPVVTWGISVGGNTANSMRNTRWNGTTWTNTTLNVQDDGTWIDCQSDPDPTSNMIACGSYGASVVTISAWTQTAGVLGTLGGNLDTSAHAASAGHAYVATTFMRYGANARPIVAWADTAADTGLDYSIFTTSWAAGAQWSAGYTTQEENIQATTNLTTNMEAIFTVGDSANDLFALRASINTAGTQSLTRADNAAAMGVNLFSTQGCPFNFVFEPIREKPLLTQSGYIWENDNGAVTKPVIRTPASGTNDTGTGTIAWTAPGNALTDNNSNASVSLTAAQGSNYLKGLDYGFAIPSSATINGISVRVGAVYSGIGSADFNNARLVKGGTIGTTNRSTTTAVPSLIEAPTVFGSSTDLWGDTWTPADINSANFGTVISVKNTSGSTTVNIDYIEITVTYSDQPTALAAANTPVTVPQGSNVSLRMQIKNTGGPIDTENIGLFYSFANDYQGRWAKVGAKTNHIKPDFVDQCNVLYAECDTLLQNNSGLGNSMAVDNNGQVGFAGYSNQSTTMDVFFARQGTERTGATCVDKAWQCTVIETNGTTFPGVGAVVLLAYDKNNVPWVVWRNFNNGNLRIAQFVGTGGSGCNASSAWTCTTIEGTGFNITDVKSFVFDANNRPWVLYADVAGGNNEEVRIAQFVGSGGTGCSTATWTCTVIQTDPAVAEAIYPSGMTIDKNGTIWVAMYDTRAAGGTKSLARFVGTGGTGCTSTAWTCETINTYGAPVRDSDPAGTILLGTNGMPVIPIVTTAGLYAARYVGTGGSCTNTAWSCEYIDNGAFTVGANTFLYSSLDPSGGMHFSDELGSKALHYVGPGGGTICNQSNAWSCVDSVPSINAYGADGIAYYSTSYFDGANTYRQIGKEYDLTGQLSLSPSYSMLAGTSVTTSHADMTSISDTTNRDDADCIGGGTWQNGVIATNDVNYKLQGTSASYCTEVVFTIDTSQATPGSTFRFAISTNDGWNTNSGLWRGPTSITQYATITISKNDVRLSKDNMFQLANSCVGFDDVGGSANYSCESLTTGDATTDGNSVSMAVDSKGTPWIAYANTESSTADLVVAKFVGSGGNCFGFDGSSGSNAWQCTTVFDGDSASDLSSISLAIDAQNNPIVAFTNLETEGNLTSAKYVGSGGNCVGFDGIGGSDEWQCTTITDGDNANDALGISIEVDPYGAPYISMADRETENNLVVVKYVGNNGNCDGFDQAGGSDAWQCTTVTDGDSTSDIVGTTSSSTSIAISAKGFPYVAMLDTETEGNLMVASYVGVGGNCDGFDQAGGSDAWQCTTVTDGDTVGTDASSPSIGIDGSGVPWVSMRNTEAGGGDLVVAHYVGLSAGQNCLGFDGVGGSGDWACETVIDGDATTDTSWGRLAIDGTGKPTIVLNNTESTAADLVAVTYVGSGGNCDGFDDVGGSDAWQCDSIVDGDSASDAQNFGMAFDMSGAIWATYKNAEPNGNVVVAKRNLPHAKLGFGRINSSPSSRNARYGDARYRLSTGKTPYTAANGSCAGTGEDEGYCGVYHAQGEYDTINANANETPYLTVARKYSNTSELPLLSWVGRTNLAPNTAGTTGDLVMQVYRFGTTNAWETIATDSTSSDCNTADCTLSAVPPGTASEYFDYDATDGTTWLYVRVYQAASATAMITLKTDMVRTQQNVGRMRFGKSFMTELLLPIDKR